MIYLLIEFLDELVFGVGETACRSFEMISTYPIHKLVYC